MKQGMKYQLIMLMALCLALLPTPILAAGEPRIQLSVDNLSLQAGQDVVVKLLVEEAPPVYGAQTYLTFDPAMLEAVTLEHGNFFTAQPAQEAFVLQNLLDNEAGSVKYSLALLNPAPPVEGNGLLATITFRAKASGAATLSLADARFGTQTGEEIMALTNHLELTIDGGPGASNSQSLVSQNTPGRANSDLETAPSVSTSNGSQAAPAAEADAVRSNDPAQDPRRVSVRQNASSNDSSWLVGLSIVAGLGLIALASLVVLLAGLVLIWFRFGRRRRRRMAHR